MKKKQQWEKRRKKKSNLMSPFFFYVCCVFFKIPLFNSYIQMKFIATKTSFPFIFMNISLLSRFFCSLSLSPTSIDSFSASMRAADHLSRSSSTKSSTYNTIRWGGIIRRKKNLVRVCRRKIFIFFWHISCMHIHISFP